MKKLMFALAVAASVCAARAEDTPIGTTTTFDDLEVDATFNTSEDTQWTNGTDLESTVEGATVTAYAEKSATHGANYLALDGVENLERKINTAIGDDGLYIDTMVQFTASDADSAPQVGANDKLVIWLRENEAEEEGGDPTYTLMITAGFFDTESAEDISDSKNYPTDATVVPGEWYNLKVQAIKNVDTEMYSSDGIAGFVVLINDTVVATTESTAISEDSFGEGNSYIDTSAETTTYAIFPSLLKSGSDGSSTVSTLAFSGSGAIDTVAAFIGDCTPDQGDPDVYALTLPTVEHADATVADSDGNTIEGDDLAAISAGTVVTITWVAAEGYVITAGAEQRITMTEDVTAAVPTVEAQPPENWPEGDDLDALAGKTVAEAAATLGLTVSGDLATADAKVFITWASGKGGVAFSAATSGATFNLDNFLLDIANDADEEAFAEAKAEAEEAIKITAIGFDENGDVVLEYRKTYGNGQVVIEGAASIPAEEWHDKAAADHFFRSVLKVQAVGAAIED